LIDVFVQLLFGGFWVGEIVVLWWFSLFQADEVVTMHVLDSTGSASAVSSDASENPSFTHKRFGWK
jgi:hypothetical protein